MTPGGDHVGFKTGLPVPLTVTHRAHLHISGTVQGVGFRASTRREATDRGVRGWVQNLPDGRVEAVFEGEESDVEGMVDWCRTGPSTASVEDVSVEYEDPTGVQGFEIKR